MHLSNASNEKLKNSLLSCIAWCQSFLLEVLRDTNAGTVCIGGFGSNSIAATSQLFTEHSIPTYALLRGERPEAKDAWHRFSGNRLITMLCLEPSAVKWQPRDRWHEGKGFPPCAQTSIDVTPLLVQIPCLQRKVQQ